MSDAVASEDVQGNPRECQQCRRAPVYAVGLCKLHYMRWWHLNNRVSKKYKEMVDGGFDRDSISRAQG